MAKLVACSGCGDQVSAKAKACPKCGHPVPQGINVGAIVGIVVIVLIVAGGLSAGHERDEQRREVATPSSPPVEVSAERLASDYDGNEVGADALYRGKVLRVTGIVQSIKKGLTDKPYVVLRAANQFMGVHANFDDDSGLAAITPGMKIVVRCIGNNVILGSPMLKGCVVEW